MMACLKCTLSGKEMDEDNSSFSIRKFDISDSERVVNIWKECGLVRDWNNTELDIQRKLSFQEELFFVGELENQIIATAMFGYDGHRGWLNYFAVALDYQTESMVCQNLRDHLKGRTVFFITHRLGTIRNADRIFLMHQGRLVEQGNHSELMELKSRYYALYRQQEAGSGAAA